MSGAVVDAQIHTWVPESERYPWDHDVLRNIPPPLLDRFRQLPLTAEDAIDMMDEVGVTGALLVSPTVYGLDHRYSFDAAEKYPGRFGVVGQIRPTALGAIEAAQQFGSMPNAVGIRVNILPSMGIAVDDSRCLEVFRVAEREGTPVFLLAIDHVDDLHKIAAKFPSLTLVIDHLGLTTFDRHRDPWTPFPYLLGLAQYDNVFLKCSSVPSYSREAYPYRDLWPKLHRILETFGPERIMWGTDYSQHRDELTYQEALEYLRSSDEIGQTEKALLLGGTLTAVTGWSPTSVSTS